MIWSEFGSAASVRTVGVLPRFRSALPAVSDDQPPAAVQVRYATKSLPLLPYAASRSPESCSKASATFICVVEPFDVVAVTLLVQALPSQTASQLSASVTTPRAMRLLFGSEASTATLTSLPAPTPAGAAMEDCALQLVPSQ